MTTVVSENGLLYSVIRRKMSATELLKKNIRTTKSFKRGIVFGYAKRKFINSYEKGIVRKVLQKQLVQHSTITNAYILIKRLCIRQIIQIFQQNNNKNYLFEHGIPNVNLGLVTNQTQRQMSKSHQFCKVGVELGVKLSAAPETALSE